MITLISKWKLKNGVPPDILANLTAVASKVEQSEPGTLMYLVNLPALSPLDKNRQPQCPPPKPIPPAEQKEVVFMEIYRDAQAFSDHVNGPVFTAFRKANIQYFQEDPNSPGWPLTDTDFLGRESAFIRAAAG